MNQNKFGLKNFSVHLPFHQNQKIWVSMWTE